MCLMSHSLCDRAETSLYVEFKASSVMALSSCWAVASQNCRCLTYYSSLARAVSHLTLSDRILCATFKSLPGLEPFKPRPSWRLAGTAMLAPIGTV